MVDKTQSNVYVWYSKATDKTGQKLVEALGCKGGKIKPTLSQVSAIVAWGAKTDKYVSVGTTPILNHPDKIRSNRNKLEALQLMKAAKVNVAPFTDNITAVGKAVKLPAIGRTKYHQGGKGFWDCPTPTHVSASSSEGAQYWQEMIEIKEEYRLHTFGDKVIYAVRKAARSKAEMEDAYIRQELEAQKILAEKNNNPFDEATAKLVITRQAKKFAQNGPNMLVRSNKLGWKFVHVKTFDKKLGDEAVKSLKAIGLDYGAVDCCIDASGKPYIIEVNTGPGLEETPFKAWVAALTEAIAEKLGTNKKQPAKKAKAAPKTATSATRAAKSAAGTKDALKAKIKLMQEMAEAADAEEAVVLDKVFGKMFG